MPQISLAFLEGEWTVTLHIYWLLPQNFELTRFKQLALMRENIEAVLKPEYNDLNVEVIFTQDEQWFEAMNPRS